MNCHLCLCFLSCLGLLGFQLFLSRCFNLVVRLTKVRTANKVGSSGLLDFHINPNSSEVEVKTFQQFKFQFTALLHLLRF